MFRFFALDANVDDRYLKADINVNKRQIVRKSTELRKV